MFHYNVSKILRADINASKESSLMLAELATRAAIMEVAATPKPGLVDRANSGSHSDMDVNLFYDSTKALYPFWIIQAGVGLCSREDDPLTIFDILRQNGKLADEAMLEATGGKNTHKGLIFHLSLLLYAAGKLIKEGVHPSPSAVCSIASRVAEGCVERDLGHVRNSKNRYELSHGERIFLDYGITGARGEAERGFPSVIDEGLPTFSRALSGKIGWNNALCHSLLHIMLVCEDTNVIHRGGYDYWRNDYKNEVKTVLLEGGALKPRGRRKLWNLDREFSNRRISPGGSADLLTVTIFLYLLDNFLRTIP